METVLVEDVSGVQEQTDEVTAGELKAALEGVLPWRRISVFYQAGLVLVAVFMVLLPLAYLIRRVRRLLYLLVRSACLGALLRLPGGYSFGGL
jgi:hypothetical protein